MSEWESPRAIAIQNVKTVTQSVARSHEAEVATDAVLHALEEPDRDMMEAGAAVLRDAIPALPNGRDIADRVWRAMLGKVW